MSLGKGEQQVQWFKHSCWNCTWWYSDRQLPKRGNRGQVDNTSVMGQTWRSHAVPWIATKMQHEKECNTGRRRNTNLREGHTSGLRWQCKGNGSQSVQESPSPPRGLYASAGREDAEPGSLLPTAHPAPLAGTQNYRWNSQATNVPRRGWAAWTRARVSMTTCRGIKQKLGEGAGGRVGPQKALAGSRLLGRGVGVHASGVPRAVEVDVLPLGVLSVPDTSLLRLPRVWNARPVDVLHEPNVGNTGSVIA